MTFWMNLCRIFLFLQKKMDRRTFTDPYNGQKGVYHFSMAHLTRQLLFKSDDDFRYGVNSLAMQVLLETAVKLLCYCLMDNHFHLLLYGPLQNCLHVYDSFLWKLSLLIGRRDGMQGILKQKAVDIQPIRDTQQLLKCIAYILRNPYKARIASPFSYRWSSMDAYFNPRPVPGIRIANLRADERRQLLHSKQSLPGDIEVVDGTFANRCFVDYKTVEQRFQDSVNFFDHLRLYDLESSYKMAIGIHETLKFTDQELLAKTLAVCQNEFHAKSVDLLDRKSLLALSRTLARRYGAGKSQLGRILGLPEEILDNVL